MAYTNYFSESEPPLQSSSGGYSLNLSPDMQRQIEHWEGSQMAYNAPFSQIVSEVNRFAPQLKNFPQDVQDGVISFRYNTSPSTVGHKYYSLLSQIQNAQDEQQFQQLSDQLLGMTVAAGDRIKGMSGLRSRRSVERQKIANGLSELAKSRGFNFQYNPDKLFGTKNPSINYEMDHKNAFANIHNPIYFGDLKEQPLNSTPNFNIQNTIPQKVNINL